jgi:hypothetical protein
MVHYLAKCQLIAVSQCKINALSGLDDLAVFLILNFISCLQNAAPNNGLFEHSVLRSGPELSLSVKYLGMYCFTYDSSSTLSVNILCFD